MHFNVLKTKTILPVTARQQARTSVIQRVCGYSSNLASCSIIPVPMLPLPIPAELFVELYCDLDEGKKSRLKEKILFKCRLVPISHNGDFVSHYTDA